MKMAARLLLAGALAASTVSIAATPASACEDPRKGCGGCKVSVQAYLNGGRLVDCPS